jgi:hypothetical protein
MAGDDRQPWEQPGAVRRDCEPHRGPLVLTLGILSIVCGSLALGAWLCFGPAVLLALLGLPLGIVAWVLGTRDLGEFWTRQP